MKICKNQNHLYICTVETQFQRNLFRKVEGIDPMKPWQPAQKVRCQFQLAKGEKNKSKVSL